MASAVQFERGGGEDANDEEMELRAYRRMLAAEQSTVVVHDLVLAPRADEVDAAEKRLRGQRKEQLNAAVAKVKKGWSWDETLDVSGKSTVGVLMQNPDNDLKREVIFYNEALVRRALLRIACFSTMVD
jgi:uncharacterized protein (DUF58 family)